MTYSSPRGGGRVYTRPHCSGLVNVWISRLRRVISNPADQIADFGCETHLRNRSWIARPWKQVTGFGEFPFGLPRRSVLHFSKQFACGVFEGSSVRANQFLCVRIDDSNE